MLFFRGSYHTLVDTATMNDEQLNAVLDKLEFERLARFRSLFNGRERLTHSNNPQVLTRLCAIFVWKVHPRDYSIKALYTRFRENYYQITCRLSCTYGIAVKLSKAFADFDRDDYVPSIPRALTPAWHIVSTWSVDFVNDWLQQKGFGFVTAWFADQQIDGVALTTINFRGLIDQDETFEIAIKNKLDDLVAAIEALCIAGYRILHTINI